MAHWQDAAPFNEASDAMDVQTELPNNGIVHYIAKVKSVPPMGPPKAGWVFGPMFEASAAKSAAKAAEGKAAEAKAAAANVVAPKAFAKAKYGPNGWGSWVVAGWRNNENVYYTKVEWTNWWSQWTPYEWAVWYHDPKQNHRYIPY